MDYLGGESANDYHDDEFLDHDFLPPELPAVTRFTFAVLYTVIITLGFTGNVTTILVIVLNREMRTVTNVFLVSLAVSDGLIAALSMPVHLKNYLQNEWTLGSVMCKFTHYLQGVVIVASILTLTALAIDRYFGICHPLRVRHLRTVSRVVLLVGAIWTISLLILVPQLFIQRLEPLLVLNLDTSPPIIRNGFVCVEYIEEYWAAIAYTSFFYVALYTMPVLVILVAYGKIVGTLWNRTTIGETVDAELESSQQLSETKRIVFMLVIIVAMFVISWFPFFTCQIYLLVRGEEGHPSGSYRVTMAYLQLLGYSNCCVNPIIYCFLSDSFQKNFHKTIASLARISSSMGHNTSGASSSGWRGQNWGSCATNSERVTTVGLHRTPQGSSSLNGECSPAQAYRLSQFPGNRAEL